MYEKNISPEALLALEKLLSAGVLTVADRRRNMKPAEWERIKNYLVEVQKNAIEELRER